jgi:hypothetical protein
MAGKFGGLIKLALALLLLVATTAYGQEQPAKHAPHRNEDLGEAADGIAGIVVNQTVTPNGNEFYKQFTILWSERPESREYSLSIDEGLSKRYGNQIWIYWGQKLMYSTPLPLKYADLKKLCEEAVEKIQAKIVASLTEQGPDEIDIVRQGI